MDWYLVLLHHARLSASKHPVTSILLRQTISEIIFRHEILGMHVPNLIGSNIFQMFSSRTILQQQQEREANGQGGPAKAKEAPK